MLKNEERTGGINMQVGDIITVHIRRYRDVDDKGIGLTERGHIVIVNDMGEAEDIVRAKITRLLERTILAQRVDDGGGVDRQRIETKPSLSDKKNVYDYDDDDDDEDYLDDDEVLDDEY